MQAGRHAYLISVVLKATSVRYQIKDCKVVSFDARPCLIERQARRIAVSRLPPLSFHRQARHSKSPTHRAQRA